MDKIRKREFVGSQLWLTLLSITVIGIPAAIVYLVNSTIETEFEVEDADKFWDSYRK